MKLLLFLISLCQVLSCKYTFQLLECKENERAVLMKPLDCDEKIQVIEGLPCDFPCEENKYLTYDKEKKTLTCLSCPPHSYTLGGGQEYSAWNSLKSFKSNCWVMSSAGWLLNTNCTSWHTSSNTLLISGSTTEEKWYESDLTFYSKLVKQGYLEVIYRKDCALDGASSEFFIFVNNEIKHSDFSNDNPNWQTVRIVLNKGVQKVQLSFNKLNTNSISQVFINKIRMSGTSFSDLKCISCEDLESHSRCLACEIGSYLNENICKECPSGHSSLPGSKKLEDCFKIEKCSSFDYHFYYSSCFEGLQEKIYEWNYPIMCDFNQSLLPEKEVVNCTACPSGSIRKSDKCEKCPTGTFASFDETCKTCPPGMFAEKVQDFHFWIPFPEGFVGKCLTSQKVPCKYSWEPRGSHISTAKFFNKMSKISLEKKVKNIGRTGSLSFSFQVFGKSVEFSLFVNKIRVFNQLGDANKTETVDLDVGENNLEWICAHSTNDDEACLIFHVKITGTDSGGAEKCEDCPEGQVSDGLSDVCRICDVGMTADADQSKCVACPQGSYSPIAGLCKTCPVPLIPSRDKESCVVDSFLNINNFMFNVANFTGSEDYKPLYCLDQGIECFQSFYGPVFYGFHVFYLSVLNPGKVLMPEFFQISNEKSYVFALLNTSDKDFFSTFQDKKVKKCQGQTEKVLVNLGKEVLDVSKFQDQGVTGFDVRYFNGDRCMENVKFQSWVRFICDKGEKEGWPVLKKYENCTFSFEWPTIYACHICSKDELRVHQGECISGKQRIYFSETNNCIMENRSNESEHYKTCSSGKSFSTFKLIFAVILLGLLVILAIFLCFYLKKAKEMYEELIKNKSETLSREISTRRGTRAL